MDERDIETRARAWLGGHITDLEDADVLLFKLNDGATVVRDMLAELVNLRHDLTRARETQGELLSELAEARNVIAVCRQTITEQAAARADPDMPLLTPEVLEQLQSDAEANYACAETRQERVVAHGLSLLCDWQERARALTGADNDQG